MAFIKYFTYSTGGITNPFLQNGGGGGGDYNYSYRDAETKEDYIRRNFQVRNVGLTILIGDLFFQMVADTTA
jgi:hypothetical protein